MSTSDHGRLGVGFLGAGPVTQAIHLPALARLTDTFRVTTVMDVSADTAASVAGRVGARSTTSLDDMLSDPDVDVVAICSPHKFHAEQVIAACRAGKRAVLCEKPFAMSGAEAEEITAVSEETGVPIVVGAMHVYDPGWRAVREQWGEVPSAVHTVRSSIVLPPNPRFEDFATEVISRPEAPKPDYDDPSVAAARVHGGVMGLAIHDLPLIRTFLPDGADPQVLFAEQVRPFGYLIVLRCGNVTVELHALMSENWSPRWILEAVGDTTAIQAEFTPSYVQAGSAVARIARGGTTTVFGPFDHNGYEGEWRHLAEVARGRRPHVSTAALIEDLTFAFAVADRSADWVRHAARKDESV